MLVTGKDILVPARAGKYGVGAFNTNNMEITQAIIHTAERLRALDPATAARVDARNGRRVVRALEVLADASGRSVSWQAHEGAMLRVARCWGETPPGGRLIVAPINAGLEQLTALAVSGRTGEPLYLVRTDQVPAVIATEIRARRPDSFALVGGVGTVRAEVRAQLGQLLLPEADGAQPRGEEAAATDSSAATKAGPPTAQS